MKQIVQAALVMILGAGVFSGSAEGADYRVDPARSELVVRLHKAGVAAVLAHNHVIRASRYLGEAEADPPSLWVEAEAASLLADEPAMRQKYGLTKPLGREDREKIQSAMESAVQLNVSRYPAIRFDSTHIERQTDEQYVVTGNLTIHGVTKTVSFPAAVSEEPDGLRGKAALSFRQSDFGITPYSAMFGAVRNKDEADLHVELYLVPADSVNTDAD